MRWDPRCDSFGYTRENAHHPKQILLANNSILVIAGDVKHR
jgi:hypothetical protein